MSTHTSTDPWRKNLSAPRSNREAFGWSYEQLGYSRGEKRALIVAMVLSVLTLLFSLVVG